MIDHASINAHYEGLCPTARVLPPIVMHPVAGDVRFYERTAHIKDVSQRFAVACSLRAAFRAALDEPIMGGDVWWKPRLAEAS